MRTLGLTASLELGEGRGAGMGFALRFGICFAN